MKETIAYIEERNLSTVLPSMWRRTGQLYNDPAPRVGR